MFVLFIDSLGVRLGCLFEVFLVSWGRLVLLQKTSRNAFAASHRCIFLYFLFDFFSNSFLFNSILLSLYMSVGFTAFSSYIWFLISQHFGWKRCSYDFSILKLRFAFWPKMLPIPENAPCAFEKNVLLLNGMLYTHTYIYRESAVCFI